jgi:hypothetical protein
MKLQNITNENNHNSQTEEVVCRGTTDQVPQDLGDQGFNGKEETRYRNPI